MAERRAIQGGSSLSGRSQQLDRVHPNVGVVACKLSRNTCSPLWIEHCLPAVVPSDVEQGKETGEFDNRRLRKVKYQRTSPAVMMCDGRFEQRRAGVTV